MLLPLMVGWMLAALRATVALVGREPYGADIAIAYVFLLLFTSLLWQELQNRPGGLRARSSHRVRPPKAESEIAPSHRPS